MGETMKTYLVSYGDPLGRVVASHDFCYVLAASPKEALEIGKPMLNTDNDMSMSEIFNKYCEYSVKEAKFYNHST